jgi:hypothetical protein
MMMTMTMIVTIIINQPVAQFPLRWLDEGQHYLVFMLNQSLLDNIDLNRNPND